MDIKNLIDIKSPIEVEFYSTSLYILVLGHILILGYKL